MFSILIPTWNNLPYLKLCIQSIRDHSCEDHEILVHVNEGSDGSIPWLENQGIKYTHSRKNIGICMAVNLLAGMATNDWLLYLNDDMVCCPGWDSTLINTIEEAQDDRLFLSSMLLEPAPTGNDRVIVQNHGHGPHDFDETGLLKHYMDAERSDMLGRASQPTLVSKRWWTMVGGYSLEFSPGMSSDDDLLMKLWVAGFRRFEILSQSRLYHFACRSTGRIRKNRGSREFALKWGITQGEFMRNYLSAGYCDKTNSFNSKCVPKPTPSGRLKRAFHGLFSDIPLGDIAAWEDLPGEIFPSPSKPDSRQTN
ncbi:glycosyltransferase family 2 protein [Acidocella sp.]|uniref:glycosyltransferase family 2 protein n=1 Tax=Acidocella sp. TaxID=50710 RepID=UPI002607FA15|nr:glycosyltransferase [Acidocella sp.]